MFHFTKMEIRVKSNSLKKIKVALCFNIENKLCCVLSMQMYYYKIILSY